MIEVTVKVPREIGELISETGEAIYTEALREVAGKRLSHTQRRLDELRQRVSEYESKYGSSYQEFSRNVPDTAEGHEDWAEWSYLDKVSSALSEKIGKMRIITGK